MLTNATEYREELEAIVADYKRRIKEVFAKYLPYGLECYMTDGDICSAVYSCAKCPLKDTRDEAPEEEDA